MSAEHNLSTQDSESPGLRSSAATTGPGSRVDRYVLKRKLHGGSMGTVFEAYDPELERRVAIKLVVPRRRHRTAETLRNEARAMSLVRHPNVIEVLSIGSFAQGIYIAMPFIEGKTLKRWLADEERSIPEILAAFVDAAKGLSAAHAVGIVHRDFKPENVMIGNDGTVVVLDFGIAVPGEPETGEVSRELLVQTDPRSAQRIVGTPHYLAPEQFALDTLGPATDQFAYCVALYEAVFGTDPFGTDEVAARADAVTRGLRVVPPDNGVPTRVRNAILRGLKPEPSQRFPSMEALIDELNARPRRRSPAVVLACGAVLSIAALSLQGLGDHSSCKSASEYRTELWPESRRRNVEAGLAESTLAYAAHARPLVLDRLTRYATTWAEHRAEACEAHAGDSAESTVLDERIACLERSALAFSQLSQHLEAADNALVLTSISAIERLPAVAACSDGRTSLPPSLPADAVELVRRARNLYVTAEELASVGRYEEAAETAESGVALARESGAPLVLAEGLLALGGIRRYVDSGEQAREAFEECYLVADANDLPTRARCASLMLSTLAESERHPEEVAHWEQFAEAAVDRGVATTTDRITLLGALAVARRSRGDYEGAIEHLEAALVLADRAPDLPHPQRLYLNHNLASYQLAAGEVEAGLASLLEVAASKRAFLGGGHPSVALTLDSIAVALAELGRPQEAVPYAKEAVEIEIEAVGRAHDDTLRVTANLIGILGLAGQNEEAAPLARETVRLAEESLGSEHPRVANALNMLGSTLLGSGDVEGAVVAFERARDVREAALGPDHPRLLVSHTLVAEARLKGGDATTAEVSARRAVEIGHVAYPDGHHRLVDALTVHGRSLRECGRLADALAVLREAVSMAATVDSRPSQHAEASLELADTLLLRPDGKTEAHGLVVYASERYAELGAPDAALRTRLNAWPAKR